MTKKSISILFIVCIFLTGCASSSKSSDLEREELAERVIETMFAAPNDNLYNETAVAVIGEGAGDSSGQSDGLEDITKNWQDALGDCFAPGVLEASVESGVLTQYMIEVFFTEEALSLETYTPAQSGDDTELYTVSYTLGEEERSDDIFFRFNDDGLIEELKIL